VTSDLFQFGSCHFLVYVDRLTGFPLLSRFSRSPSSSDLIKELRIFFALMGAPNAFRSDNGPQYRSRLKAYYDRSTKIQDPLPAGTSVLVQNPISKRWDGTAVVVGIPDRRRYHLRFPSGRILWRNRKFIRKMIDKLHDPLTNKPSHTSSQEPNPRK
ncbi:hypothetical protein TCAL_06735, partial [Tigriopus californicus]